MKLTISRFAGSESAEGATCESLGQRPRNLRVEVPSAEGAKSLSGSCHLAPSALLFLRDGFPGALPQAFTVCAVGA